MTLRALVVDDEIPARLRLRELIADTEGIECVGEAADVPTAVASIGETRPDLVFLDIQIPGGGGLAVAQTVGCAAMPAVVFVTAFERYAVPAFDLDAVDYLLKPFDDARFASAVARVRRRVEGPGSARAHDTFVVRERGSTRWIPSTEIEWVQARDQYAVLHLRGGGDAWMRASLRELEGRLAVCGFVRVHRSTIVDPGSIREVRPRSHGDLEACLDSGVRVRVSRTFRDRILAALASRSGAAADG